MRTSVVTSGGQRKEKINQHGDKVSPKRDFSEGELDESSNCGQSGLNELLSENATLKSKNKILKGKLVQLGLDYDALLTRVSELVGNSRHESSPTSPVPISEKVVVVQSSTSKAVAPVDSQEKMPPPVESKFTEVGTSAPLFAAASYQKQQQPPATKGDIPLRVKRPEKSSNKSTSSSHLNFQQQPSTRSLSSSRRVDESSFDLTASQKDVEMQLDLDAGLNKRGREGSSSVEEKLDYQRRFQRTVALSFAQNQKPYTSEFGRGRVQVCGKRKEQKCVDVVRKKQERAVLPGYACPECEKFYEAMFHQGIFTKENLPDMMKQCSKHKAKYTPPDTPEGFWDLSVNTPTEWKVQGPKK